MSQGEYDLITNGMQFAQVVTIVGGPGTMVSQYPRQDPLACLPQRLGLTTTPCFPPTISVQDYRWTTDSGGQALITFENGRVSAKTQSGP
jgi:hypothetical protein